MPRYSYTALIESGDLRRGEITAASPEAVVAYLEGRREHAVSIEEAGRAGSWLTLELTGRSASPADVTLLTRQLAWLLRAGLTLPRALELLAEEFKRTPLAPVVEQIHVAIRTGEPLSAALEQHPRVFGPDYVSMIQIAEASGMLPVILEQVATTRERDEAIRRKLVSAMIYPGLLITIAVGAVVFILLAVVPRIKDMLAGPQTNIPASAARLIAVSDWLIANGWLVALGLAGLLAALLVASRQPGMRRTLGNTLLRLPLVGPTLRLATAVRFSRTLATLLGAGVGLPASMELMKRAATNRELTTVLTGMGAALRKGEDFLAPLAASWLFPPLFARILRIGEETGNLVPSLQQVATIFEDKLTLRIERALALFEPLIILCLSAVVGLIIASVMDAIISVNDLAL